MKLYPLKIHSKIIGALVLVFFISCTKVAPPQALGPVPSERQLIWQDLQYYGFIHFNMNTFTNMEWGTGGESPAQFNPTNLDTRQWAKVAKEAGMKGLIITAKHHDGFCLWPTKTTEHSVKNSPWRNGEGDLVKELAEACKEYGLKFGVYLSPWDRNNADYGTPKYVETFHEQLRELLTNYGDVFEVWFDGANGGSGYYGGANETRKIDNKTYYQWDKTHAIVRELQPNAVIFSDEGPDVRWVGNEEGWANETNWSIMRKDEIYPGWPRYVELRSGHEDGTHWLPAEADVSIRPGWYYHKAEDHQVKSLAHLVDIYYNSIGRNANFLLNLPVDARGLVHEKDIAQLQALKHQVDEDFKNEIQVTTIAATNSRGGNFKSENIADKNNETYWATEDSVHSAALTLNFGAPTKVNRVLLQEYITLGQRIQEFKVLAEIDGTWQTITEQTTIGYKRILRFKTVTATKLKIEISKAKGAIVISNVQVFEAPKLLVPPTVKRDKNGKVTLSVPDEEVEIYYTIDGSTPSVTSTLYTTPLLIEKPTTLQVIGVDVANNVSTSLVTQGIDIPKKDWKVTQVSSGKMEGSDAIIDENPLTNWSTENEPKSTQFVVIDLGEMYNIKGFTYWPDQSRYPSGIITDYEFYTSTNGKAWSLVASGEFSNIVNSRVEQKVDFETNQGRFIKLVAKRVDGETFKTTFPEIGVITE